MSRFQWSKSSHAEAFDDCLPAWRKLRQASPLDPYLDPAWYHTWWRCFGDDADLWLLSLSDAMGECSAFVPLMCRQGVMSFIGNIYSHRQGLAAHGDMEAIIASLLEWLSSQSDWDAVHLSQLPVHGPEASAIQRCLGSNQSSWSEAQGETELWAIPTTRTQPSTAEQWQHHLAAQSREARRKRRRVHNRAAQVAAQDSPFQLQCFTGASGAKLFVRHYFQILANSWKAPEQSRDFFRQLCHHYGESGWFHSYVLMHRDAPIACQLGFLCDHTYYCYKTAYAQQYAAFSPGILVMDLAFMDLATAGLGGETDLLTGDTPYKQLWCNQRRPQVSFSLGTLQPLAQPAVPSEVALISFRWQQTEHSRHPWPEGELCPAATCTPIEVALATGATNLQSIEERIQSPQWTGLAHRHQGQIKDVVWLEITDTKPPRLHLSPPFVRVARPARLGLISALLENAKCTEAYAHIPPAHAPQLKALGFYKS